MCCKRAIPPFQWWISTRQKVIYTCHFIDDSMFTESEGFNSGFKGGGIHAQDTTKEGLFYIIS